MHRRLDEFDRHNKWKQTQMDELSKLQRKIDNMPMYLQLNYHN